MTNPLTVELSDAAFAALARPARGAHTPTAALAAVAAYRSARVRLTHGVIVAEFVALAQVRGIARSLSLQFVADLMQNPDIEVVWPEHSRNRKALDLLLARSDKTYSLCDALSFV